MKSSLTQKSLILIISVLLPTQSVLASVSEANIWKERRAALSSSSNVPVEDPVTSNSSSRRRPGSSSSKIYKSNKEVDPGFRRGDEKLASLPAGFNPDTILKQLPSVGSSLNINPQWKSAQKSLHVSKSFQNLLDSIPLTYGSIQDVYDSGDAKKAPVVLIQDIHLNSEAQNNIAAVLQELISQKQLGLVGVEGAFSPFDFSRFRAFSDKKIVKDVGEEFLNKNLLAGPAYVGITSPIEPPHFIGVDDLEHYKVNVKAYLSTIDLKEKVKAQLGAEKQALNEKKKTVFSAELKSFDELRTAFHKGDIGLGAYVQRLNSQFLLTSYSGEARRGKDGKLPQLENPIHTPPNLPVVKHGEEYDPIIEQFISAYEMERSLNFQIVDAERRTVIEKLTKVLKEKELSDLLAQSLAYRMGRLSFGDYYQNLKDLCASKGILLSATPAFDNYIRYVLLSDGIKPDKLLAAVDGLEDRVLSTLAKTPKEKNLADESEHLALTEKLIEFALTPNEWEKYNLLSPSFSLSMGEGGRRPDEGHLKSGRKPSPYPLPTEGRGEMNLEPFESFYSQADIRSQKMLTNLLSANRATQSASALVIGGFHSPEISQLLRAQKISYAIVTPKLTKIDDASGSAYLSVFAREKESVDLLFKGEKLFLSPVTNAAIGTHIPPVQKAEQKIFEREVAKTLAAGEPLPASAEKGKSIGTKEFIATLNPVRFFKLHFGRGGYARSVSSLVGVGLGIIIVWSTALGGYFVAVAATAHTIFHFVPTLAHDASNLVIVTIAVLATTVIKSINIRVHNLVNRWSPYPLTLPENRADDPSEKFKKYESILASPIDTPERLELAIEFISHVSPRFGRVIVEEVMSRKIPIFMHEGNSRAGKKLNSVLNPEYSYASDIVIRKGASINEVIHEFIHAIPRSKMPSPLDKVATVRVNPKDSLETIKETLVKIGFLEEATSISGEIFLLDDVAAAGLEACVAYCDQSLDARLAKLRPAFEASGRDVNRFVAEMPVQIPHYQKQFDEYAERTAPLMKQPYGKLMNIPWTPLVDESGITLGPKGIRIDEKKLRANLPSLLFNDNPNSPVNSALRELADFLQHQKPQRSTSVAPVLIKDITIPAPRLTSTIPQKEKIEREKNQTDNRVRIAGRIVWFLNESLAKENGDISELFSAALKMVKHLDGNLAQELWNKLFSVAKTKFEKDPRLMRDLGFSLLEAGFRQEGSYALNVYVVGTLDRIRIWKANNSHDDWAGSLLVDLVKHNEIDLAKQVCARIETKLSAIERGDLNSYWRDFVVWRGFFREGGEAEFNRDFPTSMSAPDMFDVSRWLKTADENHGPYSTGTTGEVLIWGNESVRNQARAGAAQLGQQLKLASSQLESQDPMFSRVLKTLADRSFETAKQGSQRVFNNRIDDLVAYYGLPRNDQTTADWNHLGELAGEAQAARSNLSRTFDQNTFMLETTNFVHTYLEANGFDETLVSFLAHLPNQSMKLDLYNWVSKSLPESVSQSTLTAFLRDWSDALNVIAETGWKGPRDEVPLNYLSETLRMIEVNREVVIDHEQAARSFMSKFLGRDIRSTSTSDIANKFRSALRLDTRTFQRALQEMRDLDTESRYVVMKIMIAAVPKDSPAGFVWEQLKTLEKLLNEVLVRRGKAPVSEYLSIPVDFRASPQYLSNRAMMAETKISRGSGSLVNEGFSDLQALSADRQSYWQANNLGMSYQESVLGEQANLYQSAPGMFSATQFLFFSPIVLKVSVLNHVIAQSANPDPKLIQELSRLLPLVNIDSEIDRDGEFDNKVRIVSEGARLLFLAGREVAARNLVQILRSTVHSREQIISKSANKASETENLDSLKFCLKDLDLRFDVIAASSSYLKNADEKSLAQIEQTILTIGKDIADRRDRFEAVSIVSSAKELESNPLLQIQAIALYRLAIQKLALIRGDRYRFGQALKLFLHSVDEGTLDVNQKDSLLTEMLTTLMPAKGRRSLELLNEAIPELAKFTEKVIRESKYPRLEKEVLEFYVEAVQAVPISETDFKRRGACRMLANVFDQVLEGHPEIAVLENLPKLATVSEHPAYTQGLYSLFGEAWKNFIRLNGTALTVDGIQSGVVPIEKALDELLPKLKKAIAEDDESQFNSLEPYCRAIIDLALNHANAPKWSDLAGDRGFIALYQLIERPLLSGQHVGVVENRLINIFLNDTDHDRLKKRVWLFHQILQDSNSSLSTKRWTLQQMRSAGLISAFVANRHESIAREDAQREREFFMQVAKLLEIGRGRLPADVLMNYLFTRPTEWEQFARTFEMTQTRKVMKEFLAYYSKDPLRDELNHRSYYRREADYDSDFRRAAQRREMWVPDLRSEMEILFTFYETDGKSQGNYDTFPGWVEGIRNTFVYGICLLGLDDEKPEHTVDTLKKALGKIVPPRILSKEEESYLDQLLRRNHGRLDVASLSQYLHLKLTRDQAETLYEVFKEEGWVSHSTFGVPNLTRSERESLDRSLDWIKGFRKKSDQTIHEADVELPAVFQNSPPIIRFALISYFKQLPFGEREAILADFKADNLTEEEAFKKFFEVTGNEKLGQYLSLRRDLIPERFRKHLKQFQEDAKPSDFGEVRQTIEDQLGGPAENYFKSINRTPLNVGTIGEVYEGILLNGTRVVIKVLTSSRQRKIQANLQRIEKVAADLAQNKERLGLKFNPQQLFREFNRTLLEELDFQNEYRNAQDLQAALPPGFQMAHYEKELVRERVVVQSFVEGVNPLNLSSLSQKRRVAAELIRLLIRHILKGRIFHDDLHPGNIRVEANGTIYLLDIGRVGRLSDEKMIVPLFMAMRSGNPDDILAVLERIGVKENYNRAGLLQAVTEALQQNRTPLDLVNAVFFESGTHGLLIKSEYLQLIKAVSTLEGTVKDLDPTLDFEGEIQSAFAEIIASEGFDKVVNEWPDESETRILTKAQAQFEEAKKTYVGQLLKENVRNPFVEGIVFTVLALEIGKTVSPVAGLAVYFLLRGFFLFLHLYGSNRGEPQGLWNRLQSSKFLTENLLVPVFLSSLNLLLVGLTFRFDLQTATQLSILLVSLADFMIHAAANTAVPWINRRLRLSGVNIEFRKGNIQFSKTEPSVREKSKESITRRDRDILFGAGVMGGHKKSGSARQRLFIATLEKVLDRETIDTLTPEELKRVLETADDLKFSEPPVVFDHLASYMKSAMPRDVDTLSWFMQRRNDFLSAGRNSYINDEMIKWFVSTSFNEVSVVEKTAERLGIKPTTDLSVRNDAEMVVRHGIAVDADGTALVDTEKKTKLEQEHPALAHLLFDEANMKALLKYCAFLRLIYDYDMFLDPSGEVPPLQYALKAGIYFPIGKNLYVTPTTQSFRRFIIFEIKDSAKGVSLENIAKSVEIKVPGFREDKREVAIEGYTTAREISLKYANSLSESPLALLEFNSDLDMYGLSPLPANGTPHRVMIYEYEHDANRLDTFPSNEMSERDRLDIVKQCVAILARLHALHLSGRRDTGPQNFRLLREGKHWRVRLAGDFEDYAPIVNPQDAQEDLRVLVAKLQPWTDLDLTSTNYSNFLTRHYRSVQRILKRSSGTAGLPSASVLSFITNPLYIIFVAPILETKVFHSAIFNWMNQDLLMNHYLGLGLALYAVSMVAIIFWLSHIVIWIIRGKGLGPQDSWKLVPLSVAFSLPYLVAILYPFVGDTAVAVDLSRFHINFHQDFSFADLSSMVIHWQYNYLAVKFGWLAASAFGREVKGNTSVIAVMNKMLLHSSLTHRQMSILTGLILSRRIQTPEELIKEIEKLGGKFGVSHDENEELYKSVGLYRRHEGLFEINVAWTPDFSLRPGNEPGIQGVWHAVPGYWDAMEQARLRFSEVSPAINNEGLDRRGFIQKLGLGVAAMVAGVRSTSQAAENPPTKKLKDPLNEKDELAAFQEMTALTARFVTEYRRRLNQPGLSDPQAIFKEVMQPMVMIYLNNWEIIPTLRKKYAAGFPSLIDNRDVLNLVARWFNDHGFYYEVRSTAQYFGDKYFPSVEDILIGEKVEPEAALRTELPGLKSPVNFIGVRNWILEPMANSRARGNYEAAWAGNFKGKSVVVYDLSRIEKPAIRIWNQMKSNEHVSNDDLTRQALDMTDFRKALSALNLLWYRKQFASDLGENSDAFVKQHAVTMAAADGFHEAGHLRFLEEDILPRDLPEEQKDIRQETEAGFAALMNSPYHAYMLAETISWTLFDNRYASASAAILSALIKEFRKNNPEIKKPEGMKDQDRLVMFFLTQMLRLSNDEIGKLADQSYKNYRKATYGEREPVPSSKALPKKLGWLEKIRKSKIGSIFLAAAPLVAPNNQAHQVAIDEWMESIRRADQLPESTKKTIVRRSLQDFFNRQMPLLLVDPLDPDNGSNVRDFLEHFPQKNIRPTLIRLFEIYDKYSALMLEVNTRIDQRLPQMSAGKGTRLLFVRDGFAGGPMRSVSSPHRPDQNTLGLNIDYLLNAEDDTFGIESVAHEFGHELARRYLNRSNLPSHLDEDEEVYANWAAAHLLTRDEIGRFIDLQVSVRLKMAKAVHWQISSLDSIAYLTAFARQSAVPTEKISPLGIAPAALVTEYEKLFLMTRWRSNARPPVDAPSAVVDHLITIIYGLLHRADSQAVRTFAASSISKTIGGIGAMMEAVLLVGALKGNIFGLWGPFALVLFFVVDYILAAIAHRIRGEEERPSLTRHGTIVTSYLLAILVSGLVANASVAIDMAGLIHALLDFGVIAARNSLTNGMKRGADDLAAILVDVSKNDRVGMAEAVIAAQGSVSLNIGGLRSTNETPFVYDWQRWMSNPEFVARVRNEYESLTRRPLTRERIDNNNLLAAVLASIGVTSNQVDRLVDAPNAGLPRVFIMRNQVEPVIMMEAILKSGRGKPAVLFVKAADYEHYQAIARALNKLTPQDFVQVQIYGEESAVGIKGSEFVPADVTAPLPQSKVIFILPSGVEFNGDRRKAGIIYWDDLMPPVERRNLLNLDKAFQLVEDAA